MSRNSFQLGFKAVFFTLIAASVSSVSSTPVLAASLPCVACGLLERRIEAAQAPAKDLFFNVGNVLSHELMPVVPKVEPKLTAWSENNPLPGAIANPFPADPTLSFDASFVTPYYNSNSAGGITDYHSPVAPWNLFSMGGLL